MKHSLWLMRLSLGLALFATIGAAQAFNLETRSDSAVLGDEALRAATNEIATAVGQNIPEDPSVKVYVYSRAVPSKVDPTRFVYLNRVELRRVFAAGPPYAYRGWLPILAVDRYGVTDPADIKLQLDDALREFFTRLKTVNPSQAFE